MWLGSHIAVAVTEAGNCSYDLTLPWETPYGTASARKSGRRKKKRRRRKKEKRKETHPDKFVFWSIGKPLEAKV